jgi:hypothetical protein
LSEGIFQHEGSVSQNVAQLQRILILEKMEASLQAYRQWLQTPEGTGNKRNLALQLEASLQILLICLKTRIEKLESSKKDYPYKYDQMRQAISNKDYGEALSAILHYLEEDLKLLDIATRMNYDRTSIVTSNRVKGY